MIKWLSNLEEKWVGGIKIIIWTLQIKYIILSIHNSFNAKNPVNWIKFCYKPFSLLNIFAIFFHEIFFTYNIYFIKKQRNNSMNSFWDFVNFFCCCFTLTFFVLLQNIYLFFCCLFLTSQNLKIIEIRKRKKSIFGEKYKKFIRNL